MLFDAVEVKVNTPGLHSVSPLASYPGRQEHVIVLNGKVSTTVHCAY